MKNYNKRRSGYVKTVEYSCSTADPFDYGSTYGSNRFSFLNGAMPDCAGESQHHPVLTSEETTTEYDSVVEYTAVAAVYSFRRSRSWNISQIEWYLKMGLAEGDEEGFFLYHAVQLYKLFGSGHRYMTAMREIERRCNLTSGTAYHPEVIKAFREGRHDYNALSGHCDEIDEIELVKSVDEFEDWDKPIDEFEDWDKPIFEPDETVE